MDNQEKFNKRTSGKKPLVLNLGDGIRERVIQNAREKIATLLTSKEAIMPTYQSQKDFFEQAQAEYLVVKKQVDNLDNEIQQQELLIEAFANAGKKKQDIQVHNTQEAVKQPKVPHEISWMPILQQTLSGLQRFVSVRELVATMWHTPTIRNAVKHKPSYSSEDKVFNYIVKMVVRHNEQYAKRPETWGVRFKPTVRMYNEKIGLIEWFENDGVPLPQYLKEFMHG